MNTGITSLSKLPEVTAVYPFHGMEIPFTIGVAALFVAFLVFQRHIIEGITAMCLGSAENVIWIDECPRYPMSPRAFTPAVNT